MFSFIKNWRENNSERIIHFFVSGFLIFLLLWQGINLYGRQQERTLPDNYNREFEEAALWLKNNTRPDDIILAEWTQGHQVLALAQRRVVATSKVYPSEAQETAERYKDIARFFFADTEDDALKIAKKYQASFVFVRKNFDWWTCRYIIRCNSTIGTIIDRMLKGDKFNAFLKIYQTDNFLIFKIKEALEEKLFAGFPENYFSGILNVAPEIEIQWDEKMPLISAVILPHHISYTYNFLADFFKKLAENQKIETFILLGPDHFNLNKSFITVSNLSWQTPWGEMKPNESIVKNLVSDGGAVIDNEINEREHSLKNLIPFIKYRFTRAQIVPIIFKNEAADEEVFKLAEVLKKFINKKTIILVSADFAHRFSLAKTQEKDEHSLAAIQNFNLAEIKNIEADAKPALILLLSLMKESGYANVNILKHTNNLDILKEGIVKTEEKTVPYLVSYFFIAFSR